MRVALFTEMGDALDARIRGRPHHRRHGDDGRRCRRARDVPARSARAHRHGAHRDAGAGRRGDRQRAAQRRARLGPAGRRQRGRRSSTTAADLFERDRARLMAVMVREAGKTLENALGDVREAIDFLRYYAGEARRLFVGPVALPGPTGETNTLTLRGRGAVRLHLAVEFPARDLHRPGGRRAGGRQCRARQAGRADADHRLPGDEAAARGRRAARRAAPAAGRRATWAQRWSRTRASGASPSPARTRRPGRSRRRWRSGAAPSCRSSPRPAASTP